LMKDRTATRRRRDEATATRRPRRGDRDEATATRQPPRGNRHDVFGPAWG
jgi:hypothetical protein